MIKEKDLFFTWQEESAFSNDEAALLDEQEGTTSEQTVEADVATQEATEWETGKDTLIEETTTETTTPEGEAEKTEGAIATEEDAATEWEEEKSITSILDELENLGKSQDEQTKKEDAVAETTEKIKEAEQKGEDTSELIAQLQQEVIELRNERKKSSITTDFLQEQVEQLHKENLGYKYGRVDEDGVMNLINNDSNLKSIISQTIKSQDNPESKTKLVDLYKSQLEKLTWLDFTDFIESQNKKAEWEMTAGWDDVADNMDISADWESLFI